MPPFLSMPRDAILYALDKHFKEITDDFTKPILIQKMHTEHFLENTYGSTNIDVNYLHDSVLDLNGLRRHTFDYKVGDILDAVQYLETRETIAMRVSIDGHIMHFKNDQDMVMLRLYLSKIRY